MDKKTLEQKIKDVVFWAATFFILYLIVGYLLQSNLLSESLKLTKIYELLKDDFGATAAFLAPVAAFVLFTNWKDQHNKEVRNEFALKVFTQFEELEKAITEINFALCELEEILPKECDKRVNQDYRPIYIKDGFFNENKELIFLFFSKVRIAQNEFNIFLDKLRYFGIVSNQISVIKPFMLEYIRIFEETHENQGGYSEYMQLLEQCNEKSCNYTGLRDKIYTEIISNVLNQLQVK